MPNLPNELEDRVRAFLRERGVEYLMESGLTDLLVELGPTEERLSGSRPITLPAGVEISGYPLGRKPRIS